MTPEEMATLIVDAMCSEEGDRRGGFYVNDATQSFVTIDGQFDMLHVARKVLEATQ